MSNIPARMRRLAIQRAAGRCEYCGLSQQGQAGTFHIDHIIPRSKGGPTTEDNLALACISCSLRKGDRRKARDPQSGRQALLYHPRKHAWRDHFRWNGVYLEGLTAVGRATVEALQLNRAPILVIRKQEETMGRHPPPETSTENQ